MTQTSTDAKQVVTYSISGETQAPKTMTVEEIEWLRNFAKKNENFKILKVRALRIRRR